MRDNLGWLSFGKIRASWGVRECIFSELLGTWDYERGGDFLSGTGNDRTQWTSGLYNQDLSWEETDQYDFGLDMDLFNHRLGITLDYYYRYTDKLLTTIWLPGNHNGYNHSGGMQELYPTKESS
ncbi:MAG: TonB-dependent receptor domain-containing protein [Butyricimonas faecihominis]